jgi:hypothetical protein
MAVPQGYSGSTAIAMVQRNCDEYTYPTTTDILAFLNAGLEQVERLLNGIFAWSVYPTVAMQTYIQLNDDIQYIESCNFSSGANNANGFITSSSPLAAGSLVYPMFQLEQGSFNDAAAGFPAVGFGPPQAYFIYSDQGYAPTTTLPAPSAPTLTTTSGTSTVAETVYVENTYVNANGETTPSPDSSQAVTTAQQVVNISPSGVSNATGYNTYAALTANGTYHLQNTSGPTALGTPYTLPSTILTSGTAAPSSNTATGAGAGGAMFMQLYPAAMIGQVNVYARVRPQLWADATTSSWTNLDTSLQEAVILWATYRVLRNRSRYDDAKEWLADFNAAIESMKESAMRRTRPKSGSVRDVVGRAYPNGPWWH